MSPALTADFDCWIKAEDGPAEISQIRNSSRQEAHVGCRLTSFETARPTAQHSVGVARSLVAPSHLGDEHL